MGANMNSNEIATIQKRMIEILKREMPEYTFESQGGTYSALDCTVRINVSEVEDDTIKFNKQLADLRMPDLN